MPRDTGQSAHDPFESPLAPETSVAQRVVPRIAYALAAGAAVTVAAWLCAWLQLRDAMQFRAPMHYEQHVFRQLQVVIERYREVTGELPAHLADALDDDEDFRVVEPDRVADYSGAIYLYRRTNAGYELLSLGADGRPVVNPAAYYDQEPISVFPTGGGAHNWSPMSYNPNTGLVYIPASYQSYPYQAQVELRPGSTGYQRPRGETKIIEPSFGPEPIPGARNGLQAWDPVNQKLRWNIAGGGGIGGGTATTAGNLVFQTINDGRFRAISADKGEILYEVRTGRTGMAPPITYEVDGTQYVAFGGGLGRAAPNNGPTDEKAENAPMMFVFTLDGKATLPTPPETPTASPPPAAPNGPAPEQRN